VKVKVNGTYDAAYKGFPPVSKKGAGREVNRSDQGAGVVGSIGKLVGCRLQVAKEDTFRRQLSDWR